MLLESAGCEASAFASAGEFLESEHRDGSDCIILDIRMPQVSGFDLLERLRELGNATPVIVVTAYADGPNRERARQLGAKAFFAKPVDDQALMDAIRWAVGKS